MVKVFIVFGVNNSYFGKLGCSDDTQIPTKAIVIQAVIKVFKVNNKTTSYKINFTTLFLSIFDVGIYTSSFWDTSEIMKTIKSLPHLHETHVQVIQQYYGMRQVH